MNIIDLIAKAVESGNVEQLAILERIQLAEWERADRERDLKAKHDYGVAMLQFHKSVQTVAKTKTADIVKQGKKVGEYDYLPIDRMVAIAVPELAEVQIDHSWDTRTENGKVLTKCTLTHVPSGFEKTAVVDLPMDTSGAKNDAQAVCAGITYGERYSFMAVTGLAAGGQDNDASSIRDADQRTRQDAQAPREPTIEDGQVRYLKGLITKAGVTEEKVLEAARLRDLKELTHQGFEKVKKKLLATLKARKADGSQAT